MRQRKKKLNLKDFGPKNYLLLNPKLGCEELWRKVEKQSEVTGIHKHLKLFWTLHKQWIYLKFLGW